MAMIAIAAGDDFAGRATRMTTYLHSAPPLDPARPVLMPGERERATAAAQAGRPLSVDASTWSALVGEAKLYELPIPQVQP
jgi:LDH2 family malate/lactate/ureidoglycolate dehydrogenase